MRFEYCPKCGKKLIGRLAGDDGKVPYCEDCRKYWFDTCSNGIYVMVYNEFDEIVLCWEEHISDKYATFTSGYMTPGENAEEAARREVSEELGIELERLEYGGTYWFGKNDILMHGFLGYTKKCDLNLSPEVDRAEWVPAKDAINLIFPEHPGDAQWEMYQMFMKRVK